MDKNRILDAITNPKDIHCLKTDELEILCSELRQQIIETTSKTGGHVASSLGACEIIVACHSVLNLPKDKLIFDVGHQSYAHMLLTDRLSKFDTLRQVDGLPGFPRPSVSEYDSSVSGHASDSISIAAGYAHANLLNKSDGLVVALTGDGAIEGGMALEALSYIGANQLKVVVILNDNEMSISSTVGAITRHLGNIRTSKSYRNARDSFQARLEKAGFLGELAVEFGRRTKDSLKHLLLPQKMMFEQLGVLCTPPINGNDVKEVKDMLEICSRVDGPVLIHCITTKGKGYAPAEIDPELFHGIGAYNKETGLPIKSHKKYWTDVFGDQIVKEAESDSDIVAITAAMEGGVGLKEFHKRFPKRYIDVGICEENAVGMAAGLAYAGKKPVVCIYSTFLQRAIDQITIDVALEDLNCVFAIDRAGFVGADGPTHHGLFDISYLRCIPNLKVMCPSDEDELREALHFAIKSTGTFAVRYPRGEVVESLLEKSKNKNFELGLSRILREGSDAYILAFGKMCKNGLGASGILKEKHNISAGVIDMRFAKPLDATAIKEACKTNCVVTIEDGIIAGGAGEGVLSLIHENGLDHKKLKVHTLGYDDAFPEQGCDDVVFERFGLDAVSIAETIRRSL